MGNIDAKVIIYSWLIGFFVVVLIIAVGYVLHKEEQKIGRSKSRSK